MNLDLITECKHAFRTYKKGNYVYGTIRSREDISDAINEGRKVVLGGLKGEGGPMLLILGFTFMAIFIGVFIYVYNDSGLLSWDLFLILMCIPEVFLLVGFVLIFLNENQFIVLSPHGIVFHHLMGSVQGYAWNEVEVEVYREHSTTKVMGAILSDSITPVLYVRLPDNNPLEIRFFKYSLKEFPHWKKIGENNLWALCTLCFGMFYQHGKGQY